MGTNSCKKMSDATLNSVHEAKNQCSFDSGWLERQQCDWNSFFWILWTWFARCWNKVEKNIFKNNNQLSSTVTTRTWVLSTEWTRTWTSIGIRMKKWWWFLFVWMVDVVIHGAWVLYRINKNKGDEPLVAFRWHVASVIFLKYSKEGRLSSNHLGIRNIRSGVCYNDTKHYQVQFEHRRIQNLLKHLRRKVFA